jgi:hypothetical protein
MLACLRDADEREYHDLRGQQVVYQSPLLINGKRRRSHFDASGYCDCKNQEVRHRKIDPVTAWDDPLGDTKRRDQGQDADRSFGQTPALALPDQFVS